MNALPLLIAAALAGADAAPFPCDKLGDELLEVYEGFGPVPAAAGPVEVKRKAVLLAASVPLAWRTFALADGGAAAGKTLVFRPFRRGSKGVFCTQGRSDAVFGAGDEAAPFLLRCLVDADGDGRFEAFTREVALVRSDTAPRTLPPPPAAPPPPAVATPLAQPVALVETPGLTDPHAGGFKPVARMRITVSRVEGEQVELTFTGETSFLPDAVASRFAPGGQESVYAVPMTDAAVVPLGGTRIRFARSGSKWTAEALDGYGRAPRLLCSGSVAEVGDTFTILAAGAQMVVPRANLPPAP